MPYRAERDYRAEHQPRATPSVRATRLRVPTEQEDGCRQDSWWLRGKVVHRGVMSDAYDELVAAHVWDVPECYSAHLHIDGERVAGAFLLKGPAEFRPMTLNMLGKNNDQIVRLAQEPAELLVVQHCHDICPPVRATLRAFTIQPGTLDRRYCCIDGKDSLRILQAYDKLDEALELSGKEPD
jgi:hypothetical protein